MKMNSSGGSNSSKRNRDKNRSNMSSLSSNQKSANRNAGRNANGPLQSTLNSGYHGPSTGVPQTQQSAQQQSAASNKYANSSHLVNTPLAGGENTESICNIAEGVYINSRLMHAITNLIGLNVEVELISGCKYEGILKTFSPQFQIVLLYAGPVLNDSSSQEKRSIVGTNLNNMVACLENKETIKDMFVVDFSQVVKCVSKNVDLDFATISKKSVLTDGEISKVDSKKRQERELIPWDDDGGNSGTFETLEDNRNVVANGWTSEDMFRYNENNYNIQTTYRDDMTDYTIKLEHRNDEDYLARKAQAEQIAREIESCPTRQKRLAKEDELDEETRFSAVVSNTKRDTDLNNVPNYGNSSSHPSRDERRDMRNDGFRTQNSRGNRNRDRDRDRGSNRGSGGGGINEPNWREVNRGGNVSRGYNAQSQSVSGYSNNFNSKPGTAANAGPGGNSLGSGNVSSGGANIISVSNSSGASSSGYTGPSPKYSTGANSVSSTTPYSTAAKTSYSAVSARHTPNDPLTSDGDSTDPKLSSSRVHTEVGRKPEHYSNEDSYSRRSVTGLPQRDAPKQQQQQQQQQRNSSKSSSEHELPKSSTGGKSDVERKSPTTGSPSIASVAASAVSSSTTSSPTTNFSQPAQQSNAQPKETNKLESSSHPLAAVKGKTHEEGSPLNRVEQNKKIEPSITTGQVPAPAPLPDTSKTDSECKESTSVGLVHSTSATGAANEANTSSSDMTANTITGGLSTEIVKTSNLNPNAKAFTPRTNPHGYTTLPNQVSMATYPGYQAQHLSTTPPATAALAGQFIPIQHSATHLQPQHPSHHHTHQHQQQPHGGVARNSYQVTQLYALQSGPYIVTPNPMVGHPTVFTTQVAGVPTPAPAQVAGLTQPVTTNQIASHGHMVPSSVAGPQVVNNQNQPGNQQGPPPQRQYRSGGKGGPNHGSGPNQQSQGYIQRQPHLDFQQNQNMVQNMTGQPIQQGHPIVSFSTAPAVHLPHHQSAQHGQPPQNITPLQLAPPAPGQHVNMPYNSVVAYNFPRQMMPPMGPPHLQPALHYTTEPNLQAIYQATCDGCPSACTVPQLPPQAVPPNNPNLQSAPNISSNAAAPNTNNGQVPQGPAPPQQTY